MRSHTHTRAHTSLSSSASPSRNGCVSHLDGKKGTNKTTVRNTTLTQHCRRRCRVITIVVVGHHHRKTHGRASVVFPPQGPQPPSYGSCSVRYPRRRRRVAGRDTCSGFQAVVVPACRKSGGLVAETPSSSSSALERCTIKITPPPSVVVVGVEKTRRSRKMR